MSEEEQMLITDDQYFLWEMAIENLEMQLNGITMEADSIRTNELLKSSILNEWKKMKGKLTEIEDIYKKFSEVIDIWIHIKKQIDQMNIDNQQKVSWIIKEKRKDELFGRTKQALLWQEIEDFIKSMENLHILIRF